MTKHADTAAGLLHALGSPTGRQEELLWAVAEALLEVGTQARVTNLIAYETLAIGNPHAHGLRSMLAPSPSFVTEEIERLLDVEAIPDTHDVAADRDEQASA